MSEPSKHQRDIMQAMLLGLRIEVYERVYLEMTAHVISEGWKEATCAQVIYWLPYCDRSPNRIRIAPGQESKTVRLYTDPGLGDISHGASFYPVGSDEEVSFFDYNPKTGAIVGGKL